MASYGSLALAHTDSQASSAAHRALQPGVFRCAVSCALHAACIFVQPSCMQPSIVDTQLCLQPAHLVAHAVLHA